ncbi:Apolipoprotein L3, partial [Microtus ochrogaster]
SSQVLRKPFIQEVTECLQDSARRDLQFPLAKEDAWKVLVAEADLSRDEEAALRKALRQLLELPVVEDKERLQKELQDRKRFVEEFPQLEKKIEEKIRKLRALADHLDQVHKGCTISNVVTNTTSVVSGVLGILGLALAPVTAGGSLLLSATGLGLGAVATVTGVATVAVEEINKWSDEAKAKRLLSDTMDTKKKVPILKKIVHTLSRGFCNVFKQLETLRQNIRAIRVARANPHLVADAKLLMTAGRISAQQASQVKNVFKGTALAMTKKARIRGAAIAGVFLAVDVYYLVRESMHLYDGAKSESAKELRALAQELEDKESSDHETRSSPRMNFVGNFHNNQRQVSGEEEAALRDALKQHLAREPADENDETEKRQRKKNFLKEFPELKRKLEEHIRKLRALADHLDEVHKGCTISNVVSGSTGIAATIAGFLLAPFTGGVSLAIAAAGLGAASAATGLTTTIVEESIRGSDESEARRLVEASMDIMKRILKIMPLITLKVSSKGMELFCTWKTIRDHIQAIRTGRIRNFTTFRDGIRQLRNLISHDIPLGTRLARIGKGVGNVSLFGFDVYNLVTDSIDLHNGAKTKSAGALREVANNLEERLREFEQHHKDLQSF